MGQTFSAFLYDRLLEIQRVITFVLFVVIEVEIAFLRDHSNDFDHFICLKQMDQLLDLRVTASNRRLNLGKRSHFLEFLFQLEFK